jgi:hypothetical protein
MIFACNGTFCNRCPTHPFVLVIQPCPNSSLYRKEEKSYRDTLPCPRHNAVRRVLLGHHNG